MTAKARVTICKEGHSTNATFETFESTISPFCLRGKTRGLDQRTLERQGR
jgi:hypothetical protein